MRFSNNLSRGGYEESHDLIPNDDRPVGREGELVSSATVRRMGLSVTLGLFCKHPNILYKHSIAVFLTARLRACVIISLVAFQRSYLKQALRLRWGGGCLGIFRDPFSCGG